jgi:uncharacterized protein (DUF362 family)
MAARTEVYIAGSKDRRAGVRNVLDAFDLSSMAGSSVAIKANYNSADSFPASTHIDTLDTVCSALLEQQPANLTLGERSGMGTTRAVLESTGVFALARDRGFGVIVLDELDRSGWQEIQSAGLHWKRGFFLAQVFNRAEHVVQTCCLKTHRYGGHVTLSLKNMVGSVARRVPGINYDFMNELHNSPDQRLMIAEINRFCRSDVIVLDATDGFASGGPDTGKLIHPGIVIAGTDRVAIDVTGIALLRSFGTVPAVMNGQIFEQEQIARASELGIGTGSAGDIRLVPLDDTAAAAAEKIQVHLDREQ